MARSKARGPIYWLVGLMIVALFGAGASAAWWGVLKLFGAI